MDKRTWGDVYNGHKAKGMDHADAAVRADEWVERQKRICPTCGHKATNPRQARTEQ